MRGLTQVFVVVLIVVVVGGLLATAVLKVREAAKGMTCEHNLKILAMSTANYEGHNNRFPLGTSPSDSLPPEKRLSWMIELWPYYYSNKSRLVLDRDKAWNAEGNRDVMEEFIVRDEVTRQTPRPVRVGQDPDKLCPNNPNRSPPGMPGITHYVGVAGVGEDGAVLPVGDPKAGIFGYDRLVRIKDVTDGTSTTLLALETTLDNGPWTAGGPPTLRGLDPERQPYLGRGCQFGGTHTGGANVAFADGSVRFVSNSINRQTLEALATIAGGEQVSPSDW